MLVEKQPLCSSTQSHASCITTRAQQQSVVCEAAQSAAAEPSPCLGGRTPHLCLALVRPFVMSTYQSELEPHELAQKQPKGSGVGPSAIVLASHSSC
jgi:hypothetical protein